MKYRAHTWLNTDTQKPEYGIQAKSPKHGRWMHCLSGLKPLIFTSRQDRDAKLQELMSANTELTDRHE